MNWINNKVLINCLANSIANAKEISEVAQGSVLIGILAKNYSLTKEAIIAVKKYQNSIGDYISIGLGAGDPTMWKRVAKIAKATNPIHINQIFTATGYTSAIITRKNIIINSLISPTGKVGFVKISTGEFSQNYEPAIVPVETALIMAKEQGANSIKFFNMKGLNHLAEFKALAQMCAKHEMILEPTGGLTLKNIGSIIEIALKMGVKKIIPHVYSSIIDKHTGKTDITKLQKLLTIVRESTNKY